MKKFYDKLLLAIASLALLAGVGFYFSKSSAVPAVQPQVSIQTADNPYQQVPVLLSTDDEGASWPAAAEQSIHTEDQKKGWIYDVFTPPKIFINEKGEFVSEGFEPPVPLPPFGIYLAEIEREPYRIQIEGYIEEGPGDASKSLVLLYDEERSKSLRSRVGETVADSEFKLLNFEVERIIEPEGGIFKEAKAKILDQRSGEEVILKHGERLFDDDVAIVIRSDEDASIEIKLLMQLSELGQVFETPLGQYTLKEINLEESSITVEKQGIDGGDAEVQVLIANGSDADPINPVPPATDALKSNSLDFIF